MAQLSKVFFPYDPLPAQDLNDMVGFMNGVADGTNLENGAVTPEKLALAPHMGTLTLTSTGLMSITGVGFKPRLVTFDVSLSSTSTAIGGSGAMTDSYQWSKATITTTSAAATNSQDTSCILVINASAAPTRRATYSSMDEDGFTINVTTVNQSTPVFFTAYP